MRIGTYSSAATILLSLATFCSADVTGKIKLDGKPPEAREMDISAVKECAAQHPDGIMDDTIVVNPKGELANVLVSVKADDVKSLKVAAPKDPAILDQKGCMYTPHVLPMMVGQQLRVANSDPLLHNVHSMSEINEPFAFTQPDKDPGKVVPEQPKAAEMFKVKCDVHPWMIAYIVVLPHPYFSVSKEDGTFAIKGLPDGDYTLEAWHEKYGTRQAKVSVKGGKAETDFTFKQLASTTVDEKIKLASFTKPGADASCPACDEAAGPTTKPTEQVKTALTAAR